MLDGGMEWQRLYHFYSLSCHEMLCIGDQRGILQKITIGNESFEIRRTNAIQIATVTFTLMQCFIEVPSNEQRCYKRSL
jgi:hypothetical protein